MESSGISADIVLKWIDRINQLINTPKDQYTENDYTDIKNYLCYYCSFLENGIKETKVRIY